jgi:tetratricopeptide (TPR) repeat protein
MKIQSIIVLIPLTFAITTYAGEAPSVSAQSASYSGSESCRECHEKSHTLWSTSRHRQTIRPYSDEFAKKQLEPLKQDIFIGAFRYSIDISPGSGRMLEVGPKGVKEYRIEQVLGGKGLYSFLTTLEDGRIEALPLAYDISKKEWYEAENSTDSPLPNGVNSPKPILWSKRSFAASDACPNCHVSRHSVNYDSAKKMYTESWSEYGVNCETCHGPAGEHNQAMRVVKKGEQVTDPRIISTKRMAVSQRNDLCSTCHAKKTSLTGKYSPGDRYFDHFDLVTLENPDFYPDGREHGENYTLTGWLMSPCAKAGKLDCMHCHTSSGRYRFKDEKKANDACLPCHADRVKNVEMHSHHKSDGPGSRCVSCHMPKTSFARMSRSDHSMRPPIPAVTVEFKSPNACNICHKDKNATWANKLVTVWYPGNSKESVLKTARLISAARQSDWTTLPEMLNYIQRKDRDEIFATSLIRLLRKCKDERVLPVLVIALKDPSPLVRSAAAESLGAHPSLANTHALLIAVQDEYRLVRIKAAASLSNYPLQLLPEVARQGLQNANEEYREFLLMEPIQWEAYFTIGNHHLRRGELRDAVSSYQAALRIEPRAVTAILSLSLAQYRLGEKEEATKTLVEAIKADPENEAALSMIRNAKYGSESLARVEKYFIDILNRDPNSADAAYSLCVLTSDSRLAESLKWCRKAVENAPGEPKYVDAFERIFRKAGRSEEANIVLKKMSSKQPIIKEPDHERVN